jgi:hypothetical protein
MKQCLDPVNRFFTAIRNVENKIFLFPNYKQLISFERLRTDPIFNVGGLKKHFLLKKSEYFQSKETFIKMELTRPN